MKFRVKRRFIAAATIPTTVAAAIDPSWIERAAHAVAAASWSHLL